MTTARSQLRTARSGTSGLADVLPMLEPAALSSATRHDLGGKPKPLLQSLRDKGVALTGERS